MPCKKVKEMKANSYHQDLILILGGLNPENWDIIVSFNPAQEVERQLQQQLYPGSILTTFTDNSRVSGKCKVKKFFFQEL